MHGPGRRPPIPGIPGDRIRYVRKSARADLRWLARPEEAALAPQGDGLESMLAATGLMRSSAQELSYFSGSANTHSMEPLSGYLISVASCETERRKPEPPPVATATYCLPFTL